MAPPARTLRGRVAVAGIGETTYYKHGKSPDAEFALALQAILRACEDAGISPRKVDGFASYSNDRNDPSRLAAALGVAQAALLASILHEQPARLVSLREELRSLGVRLRDAA